jgi:superfamily II DNA or RNA helicase
MSILHNSRVFQPEHPEHGYGTVRLVEESVLSDERICQVAFEWVPGLMAVPEAGLQVVPNLNGGRMVQAEDWGSVDDLQRRLGAALVMAENSQSAAFIRSFTMPLPHQAYVLEKILANRRFGHVIADDVGMGKTIEAGLIVASLRQRDPQCRVLVLCPAGVVLQWQDEMEEHFGLNFSIAGIDFKPDRKANWESHNLVLASLDLLKQDRLRETLKGASPFDLIVCDEAHRLTARREFLSQELYRTQNYRFVEWLAQERVVGWETKSDGSPRSPRLLLMSATPHQGDDLRFGYLLQLVRPDKIDAEEAAKQGGALGDPAVLEECLTRTAKKRAVDWSGNPIFVGHDTRTLEVPLTVGAKNVLARLTRYIQSEMVFKESKGEALVRALAMHTFQKIAASSWAALRAALASRMAKAGGGAADSPGDAEAGTSMGEEFAFFGGSREMAALRELIELLDALSEDRKWELLQGLLQPGKGFRQAGDRILIFTQFRVTQSWLAEKLSKCGELVMQIHGGMGLEERRDQRIAFEDKGTILISTEAGSEGANLHRRCHLMVNYDLPWNPMRLLQRIGRLDRYGQKHRVLVANLKAPESWDAMVARKIETKLAAVQASMGLVAEEDYRTMILGSIHEAVDVADLMRKSRWGQDENVIDEAVDEAVGKMLARKSSFENLFRESLGMPQGYGQGAPALSPEDFRQVFAWSAAAHGSTLRESRTADNKFLKGVYHFTLPSAFRGGLRASNECYLVFDREVFAEVRGTTLGRVRGQEIKPVLAGFGDAVTDWFFRRALHAGPKEALFQIARPAACDERAGWWMAFAARWKTGGAWVGPDLILIFAIDNQGRVLGRVGADVAMRAVCAVQQTTAVPGDAVLPSQEGCVLACRDELRRFLDFAAHGKSLALNPFCLIKLA